MSETIIIKCTNRDCPEYGIEHHETFEVGKKVSPFYCKVCLVGKVELSTPINSDDDLFNGEESI